eukprot:5877543-Prymnesium_polylepis.1
MRTWVRRSVSRTTVPISQTPRSRSPLGSRVYEISVNFQSTVYTALHQIRDLRGDTTDLYLRKPRLPHDGNR